MGRTNDLTNQTFGRLTVVRRHQGTKSKPGKWECKCVCGNTTFVTSYKLTSGHTKSCGCLHRERTSETHKTHGLRHTKLYNTWRNIKDRCYNPNNQDYHTYGGRGITVCDEWLHDFKAFYDWAITHGYTDGLTIDRKNNDLGYSSDNCRWATNAVQSLNKRNTVLITLFGKTKPLKTWCDLYHKNYQKAYDVLIRYKQANPEDFLTMENPRYV